jgi:hypothetical protein
VSSKPYIVHKVSNNQPTGLQVGDEYYDPVTNRLYKALAINGTTVTASELPVNINGNLNLGNVANITITGGVSGYVLSTNGTGNLSWVIPFSVAKAYFFSSF